MLAASVRGGRGYGSREALLESVDGGFDLRPDAVIKSLLRGNILQHRGIVRLCELQEFALETTNVRDGHTVYSAARCDVKAEHLFFNGKRRVLILLQNFGQALPAGQLRLGDFVELIGTELRTQPAHDTAPYPSAEYQPPGA